MTRSSGFSVSTTKGCDELVTGRTVAEVRVVLMTVTKIGDDNAHDRRAASAMFAGKPTPLCNGRDRSDRGRERPSTYFITLSVKIAIDFTPPARLRSMASIATS
jgi:hypothetical protein